VIRRSARRDRWRRKSEMEGDGEVWTEGDGEVKVRWRERREGDGKVWTEGDACRMPAHHVPTELPVT
jgi:hypothetical protein